MFEARVFHADFEAHMLYAGMVVAECQESVAECQECL